MNNIFNKVNLMKKGMCIFCTLLFQIKNYDLSNFQNIIKATNFISLFILLFIFGACKNYSDEKIISKTIEKLNSIQTIEYVGNYERYEDNTGKRTEYVGNSYFDFSSNDSLLGAKYIIAFGNDNYSGIQYFDGKSVVDVEDNRKEIIKDDPNFSRVNNHIFVLLSFAKLRQALPLLQKDSAVTFTRLNDTIINNTKSYYFKIEITNKYLGLNKSIIQHYISEGTARYNLAIAKSTFLPIQFEQISAFWYQKNTFSEIKLNNIKDDSIWNGFENYSEEYIRLSYQDWMERGMNRGKMYEGAKAIDWTLQNLQEETVTLSDLNKNHTLLMFWFPGCVPCVQAVPVLNELERKYAQKGLKIYAIEYANNKKEFVENYVKEKEVTYSILYNGKETANQYGVEGAPTFYLIDKTGTIIYSQAGLNEKELVNSVESLLK